LKWWPSDENVDRPRGAAAGKELRPRYVGRDKGGGEHDDAEDVEDPDKRQQPDHDLPPVIVMDEALQAQQQRPREKDVGKGAASLRASRAAACKRSGSVASAITPVELVG
jgi:hypothetical protein